MATNIVIFPRYQDIYDGSIPTLKEVLTGIPTCIIVGAASHINAWKHHSQFDFKIDIEIFRYMIGRLSNEGRDALEERMKSLYFKTGASEEALTIYPLPQMLQLIEWSIRNYQDGPFEQITPEEEENILKAILILNTNAEIKSIPPNVDTISKDLFERFISISWPFMLPTIEHTYRKEIIIPIYQAFLLFEFLEKDKFFKPYLENFLSQNGLKSYAEYLKNLMSLYLFSFDKSQKTYSSNFKEEDLKTVPLFQQFTRRVDISASKAFSEETKFFKLLREKPILQIDGGKCFISNWNYIIDKMYDGIKYDFFEHSGIKEKLSGDEKQKFNGFTSKLGQNFSEKVIFQDMANRYLKRNDSICVFEDTTKGWNQDLYHRKDNHVSFIEYKAITLPLNDNYEVIKRDVDNKMVTSINEKRETQKKAVYQLIDQISSFHANINKFEDLESLGLTRQRLCIYPIIVFTDLNWRLSGVNDYLARIFKEEISKLKLDFFFIEELAMIHVNFLYNYENIFLKENMNLHQFVYRAFQIKDSYRANLNKPSHSPAQTAMDAFSDFEFYAHGAFRNCSVMAHEMTLFNEILKKLDLPKE